MLVRVVVYEVDDVLLDFVTSIDDDVPGPVVARLAFVKLLVVFDQVVVLVDLRLVLRPVHLVGTCCSTHLLAIVGVQVRDLHGQEVGMVFLLNLSWRPRVLTVRVLNTLLASIKHVVLVRLRCPTGLL